jgi:hypothetical protein
LNQNAIFGCFCTDSGFCFSRESLDFWSKNG